ncbi:MAG: efflux RND transporter periplasmic adaptor subunit [Proteobacteria bacterium]|nr:efflux RND transporter periplasmic adaptor subunit [Pseudomonadota bacterium]
MNKLIMNNRTFIKHLIKLGTIALALTVLCLPGCDSKIDINQVIETHHGEKSTAITGLINATEIDVASKVPGRIQKVHVYEGQHVQEGDLLIELTLDELDAKMRQAQSGIDAAKAQLALARKGARPQEKKAAENQVSAARAQVDVTKKMLDRMDKLLEEKAVPQAKYDEVAFKYQVSVNQLAMAEAKLDAINTGAREEEIRALESLVAKGENVASEIEIYMKEKQQVAPVEGDISKIIVHEGELTNTGYPIITIVKLDDVWASFAVREDKLKNLKMGDKVEVEIPALDKKVAMTIAGISVMADFATWRATSDRDRFDLKSFEVKLRPVEPIENIRPGMTVRWDIDKTVQ